MPWLLGSRWVWISVHRDQLHQSDGKAWPNAKEDPVPNLSRTFPPDNCSLSAICLRLPSLMSGTLCHLSQPCRERSKQPKVMTAQFTFSPAVMMSRPRPIIHCCWLHPDTEEHGLDLKVILTAVTSHLVNFNELTSNIKTTLLLMSWNALNQ